MFSLKNQIGENLPVVEVSRQMRGRYQSQLDVDCVFVCSNGDIKASIFAVYPSDFFRGKVETLYRNRSFPLIIDCKGMAFYTRLAPVRRKQTIENKPDEVFKNLW